MRYRYCRLVTVRGVTFPDEKAPIEVATPSSPQLRMAFARADESVPGYVDTYLGLANLLLEGMVGDNGDGGFDARVANAIANAKKERVAASATSPLLVLEVSGDYDWEPGEFSREEPRFVVSLDGPAKGTMAQYHSSLLDKALCALALSCPTLHHAETAAAAIEFMRPDGKPIYAYYPQVSANLSVSTYVEPATLASVDEYLSVLSKHPSLTRVVQLIAAALGQYEDPLRSFLTGWSALEILTSKLYPQYEAEFTNGLSSPHAESGYKHYLERVREVMKTAVRITDKYAIISAVLAGQQSSADIETFRRAKKYRDRLLHGEDIPEESLPSAEPARLAKELLVLHTSRTPSQRSAA